MTRLASVPISLVLLLAATPGILAQNATDLYLVTVTGGGASEVAVGPPVRLTDRDGYDNQPSFAPDGSALYYTSMRGEQSDIWSIPFEDGKPGEPRALFETPESEYSPTPIPGEAALSVIRVEADERQRLWRLPLGGGAPDLILPAVEPVGYHAWLDRELVLFVLDEPHRLVRVSADDPGQPRTVASDIGRALHRIPEQRAFSFVHKEPIKGSDDPASRGWRLTRLDADGDRLTTLVRAPEGREDVAWSPDGSLWSADGTRLLRWRPGQADWTEVADLGRHGIFGITRLAFDARGKRLAFVARRPPEKTRQLDLVDLAIERHGGALFTSSETSLKVCSRSGCFDVNATLDGGRYLYDVSGKQRDTLRRVRASNERVEQWRGGEPRPVTPEEGSALRDWAMARVYFPFLPFRLNDASVWKQDLGVELWSGRPLHKVRVSFDAGSSTDAGDVYMYWFDPESGQLVQFAYSYHGNPGGLRFRRLVNERRVGGLLFHDQENLGAEGEGLTVERLTPETVRGLRRVSEVTFRDIEVRPLGGERSSE